MKRSIICADVTWNLRDQLDMKTGKRRPSNVTKLARVIRSRSYTGIDQVVSYHAGVGTGAGVDNLTGGMFGDGIEDNIGERYRFLIYDYVAGDERYLFRFCRSAIARRYHQADRARHAVLGRRKGRRGAYEMSYLSRLCSLMNHHPARPPTLPIAKAIATGMSDAWHAHQAPPPEGPFGPLAFVWSDLGDRVQLPGNAQGRVGVVQFAHFIIRFRENQA